MPSETLALAAYQLIEAGFHQAKHQGPGGFGNPTDVSIILADGLNQDTTPPPTLADRTRLR